jgi:hypothetical protein
MNGATKGPLADSIELYLAHKHSLGKQLAKVGPMLHWLDSYLLAQGIGELRHITATHIDAFIASRPRHSPRSYNGAHRRCSRAVRLDGGSRTAAGIAGAM